MQKEGLFYDLPSATYHGTKDTWSSSQLKVILEDEEQFFNLYISKTATKEHVPAFDVGTYFHTSILEPHKLKDDCVVYTGKQRRGADWEIFKKKHPNKAILTKSQVAEAQVCIDAVKKSPVSMEYIENSESEVSAFINIRIVGDTIYAPSYKVKLGRDGWVKVSRIPEGGINLTIKARSDKLGETFILDLKSTRGNTKNEKEMQKKVDDLDYDLSAALYLDIFSLVCERKIRDFIWTFASKETGIAKSWRADYDSIVAGRKLWKKAILLIAHGIETNWVLEDTLGILPPSYQKRQLLNTLEEEMVDL